MGRQLGCGAPLAAYLRRFDFELQAALRPSEGLSLLAGGGVDAVILDVMLPEMDGFEVCCRIRQTNGQTGGQTSGQTSHVPVRMLTACGELSDRVVGLELGADDYLPKPFEPRELAARLQTILRRGPCPPVPPRCCSSMACASTPTAARCCATARRWR